MFQNTANQDRQIFPHFQGFLRFEQLPPPLVKYFPLKCFVIFCILGAAHILLSQDF